MNQPNTRAALFQVAQTANACDRIAANLDWLSRRETRDNVAALLSEAASELAHHADALRESSGLTAATDANLAEIARNLSTR